MAFDELNDPDSPGETLAFMETFVLNRASRNDWLQPHHFASRRPETDLEMVCR